MTLAVTSPSGTKAGSKEAPLLATLTNLTVLTGGAVYKLVWSAVGVTFDNNNQELLMDPFVATTGYAVNTTMTPGTSAIGTAVTLTWRLNSVAPDHTVTHGGLRARMMPIKSADLHTK
ncbi:hypothetical protein GCM10011491_34970 [Brucella endophytica]|uniref:Uncharacterized protein n=1 Tax=Brucella endophytica TaxID=1963359 RepID=A0A916WIQ8_9HYPH|nr:hypothetical protein [Brucella endophytica]GGB03892.1 hypothetical protein GCM10011491_34970 [Brucella endophytica]